MKNETHRNRTVLLYVSALVALAVLFLLWPVRLLVLQEEELGISPVFPSRSIPFIAGGLVAAATALLYSLSKAVIGEKLARAVILATTLVVAGFVIIIMLHLMLYLSRWRAVHMEPVG